MDLYGLLIVLHVILFCYWLGADLGVFYAARFMINPAYSAKERAMAAKILAFVDQFPRVAMPLMFAVGMTLSIMAGYMTLRTVWLLPIWIVTAGWVGMVIWLYLNKSDREKIQPVKTFDYWFRVLVILKLGFWSIASLMGNGLTDDTWLALKVLLFTWTVFAGLMVRLFSKDFGPAFAKSMDGTATEADEALVQSSMFKSKCMVVSIWVAITLAGALGLLKPV